MWPFNTFICQVGLRYTRARRRNRFVSFNSLISVLGIVIGVTALITVLAVMNGFDDAIRQRIFSMASHIAVRSEVGVIHDWRPLQKRLQQEPGVVETAPYINMQGLLRFDQVAAPAILQGVLPASEKQVSKIGEKFLVGSLDALVPGKFGIVLGVELAGRLGVDVGDKVVVITPQMTASPAGVTPRLKRFTVVGIFRVGNGFGFDKGLAFMHMGDAQALFRMGQGVSGIRLKINDLYEAPRIASQLAKSLNSRLQVFNWTQDYGPLFEAIRLEKTMMFLLLLLIVGVAVFNLVSTLVMVVKDKESDIAVLRTLGATPRQVMGIFIVQGLVISLIGIALGILGGVLLAGHLTEIVSRIESLFHVQLFSTDAYYIDYLPSKLLWHDVWHVCVIAVVMSLLATLYPALRAARLQPAEVLRYE